jgi:hypothetical protein
LRSATELYSPVMGYYSLRYIIDRCDAVNVVYGMFMLVASLIGDSHSQILHFNHCTLYYNEEKYHY